MSPRLPLSPSPASSRVNMQDIHMDRNSDSGSPSDTTGTSATNESATVTPPPMSAGPTEVATKLESPRPTRPIDAPFLSQCASELDISISTSSDLDSGLQDAIRGVYRLWSSSRSQSKHRQRNGDVEQENTSASDKDAFVHAVRMAVDSL